MDSDTPWCVYKIMNINIFSDLRKPGLVPGKSLSPSTKFDSVLEKNKFYKTKYHFRYTSVPFGGKLLTDIRYNIDHKKLCVLMEMPLPMSKKNLQSLLGIMNYLGKYLLATSEIYEPPCKLTSVKLGWTWNKTLKEIIKE